ncbi:MAG: VanW family protein [Clostridia bacterium]|nr:VanW family protein [Clostridia bacterium]
MKYRKRIAIILSLLLILCNTVVVAAKEESESPKAYVKVTSSLNVREGPSTRYSKVAKLKPGDLVSVVETTKDGWSKVILPDGAEGYVSNEYIVIPEYDAEKYEIISSAVITQRSSSSNRNFNMAKACEGINGLELQPGDEFNWYGDEDTEAVVGPANKANGYKQATVISGGKYVKGYGGGVCQVSTAVYNCILKLGIEPTERHKHSLQSSYVAKGMDATVSYPNKNFVFTNTLEYPIMFEAYTDGGQVIILAYKVLD